MRVYALAPRGAVIYTRLVANGIRAHNVISNEEPRVVAAPILLSRPCDVRVYVRVLLGRVLKPR